MFPASDPTSIISVPICRSGFDYAEMKPRLEASKFRSRFKLNAAERAYLAEKGFLTVRAQAVRIVRERLAPAHPANDGRQTPMRGHAVFKAQHACALCCRGCLEKWHNIPAGRELTEDEIGAIADMIVAWLRDKSGDLTGFPHTPDLFAQT